MIEAFNLLGLGLRRAMAFAGIDEAMRPILFSRVWVLVAGPMTMFMVATFLSPEEQGYNYTFASILALQTFLELGFSQSVIQFTAHEAAHLSLSSARTLQGDPIHIARTASFFRFFVKWYSAVAVAFFCLVGPGGYWFLGREPHRVVWLGPWWLLVLATTLSILFQPIIHFLTGLNQVAFTNRVTATNTVILNFMLWAVLFAGGKLFANGFAAILAVFLLACRIGFPYRPLWAQLWHERVEEHSRVNFKRDIFPFQSRITFTFLTGYLVFELFTPASFRLVGAAEAGRFGMTLAILFMVTGVSQAFVSNKAPVFGVLVSSGRRAELRKLFQMAYIRCVAMALVGLSCGVVLLSLLKQYPLFADRILEPRLVVVLAIALLLQCIGLALTYFVRAHREEPFVTLAWIQAIVTIGAILILGRAYGVGGICAAYLISWCVGTPCILRIFRAFWSRDENQVYASVQANRCNPHL